ncbi:MAG: hypothetical protein NTY53_07485, partial [Kiritimatiellaeota bacterium]|nr:hypothetical protein [Kiritimatiellota bacterium]
YGSVLIAISSATPFEWKPDAGIRAPAGKPRAGDSEFRVPATQTALAIETALPAEFAGATPAEQLAAFRTTLLAKTKIECQAAANPLGRYTDRHYAHWPSLENPWMSQPQPGAPFTIRAGAATYPFAP